MEPFAALRPFLGPPPVPGERCELCATPVGEEHAHVVNVETRELLCACRPCHLMCGRSLTFRFDWDVFGLRPFWGAAP